MSLYRISINGKNRRGELGNRLRDVPPGGCCQNLMPVARFESTHLTDQFLEILTPVSGHRLSRLVRVLPAGGHLGVDQAFGGTRLIP